MAATSTLTYETPPVGTTTDTPTVTSCVVARPPAMTTMDNTNTQLIVSKATGKMIKSKVTKIVRFKEYYDIPKLERSLRKIEIDGKKLTEKQIYTAIAQTCTIKRIVTVYYKYNRQKNVLKYGASIYVLDESYNHFDRKKHVESAMGRFNKNPVVVNDVTDDSNIAKFNRKIRRLVHRYGVKGPRVCL